MASLHWQTWRWGGTGLPGIPGGAEQRSLRKQPTGSRSLAAWWSSGGTLSPSQGPWKACPPPEVTSRREGSIHLQESQFSPTGPPQPNPNPFLKPQALRGPRLEPTWLVLPGPHCPPPHGILGSVPGCTPQHPGCTPDAPRGSPAAPRSTLTASWLHPGCTPQHPTRRSRRPGCRPAPASAGRSAGAAAPPGTTSRAPRSRPCWTRTLRRCPTRGT